LQWRKKIGDKIICTPAILLPCFQFPNDGYSSSHARIRLPRQKRGQVLDIVSSSIRLRATSEKAQLSENAHIVGTLEAADGFRSLTLNVPALVTRTFERPGMFVELFLG